MILQKKYIHKKVLQSSTSNSSIDKFPTLAGLVSLLLLAPYLILGMPGDQGAGEVLILPPWEPVSLRELVEPADAMESLLREPFRGGCSEEESGGVSIARTSVVRVAMYFWKRAP